VFYFKENKFDEAALKQRYVSALKNKIKIADSNFYSFAIDPKNIKIRPHIILSAKVIYSANFEFSFSSTEYFSNSRGYTVTPDGKNYKVSENKEWHTYTHNGSRRLSVTDITKTLRYSNNEWKNLSEFDFSTAKALDEYNDQDTYTKLLALSGFRNVFSFRENLEHALCNINLYDEIECFDYQLAAKNEISKTNPHVQSLHLEKISSISIHYYNDDNLQVCFEYVYEIGVNYNNKDYFIETTSDFNDIPIEYSEEALAQREKKIKTIRSTIKKKRNRAIACFVSLFVLCALSFVLVAINEQSIELSLKYNDWMAYFICLPQILVELLPLILLIVSFCKLMSQIHFIMHYSINPDYSEKPAEQYISEAFSTICGNKIVFYFFWCLSLFYILLQIILMIIVLL